MAALQTLATSRYVSIILFQETKFFQQSCQLNSTVHLGSFNKSTYIFQRKHVYRMLQFKTNINTCGFVHITSKLCHLKSNSISLKSEPCKGKLFKYLTG